MTDPIILPPGVAIAILAFLLSLLPAGLFMWLWYLRRHERPVPAMIVGLAFVVGIVLVVPAFYLEKQAPLLWERISPSTVHYFDGALLPLQTWQDILLPAVGTFLVVALIEEGVRYLTLFWWLHHSESVDQVFDGMLIGIAMGLGFATLENALYFFQLFSQQSFDTLVFVFFLRFMVSTLAHISFGGIMGALLAQGVFSLYQAKKYYLQAFFITWFLHGAYDWLLGVNQAMYAILILLPSLLLLLFWGDRRDFLVINRDGKKILMEQRPPNDNIPQPYDDEPWNKNAPWVLRRRRV